MFSLVLSLSTLKSLFETDSNSDNVHIWRQIAGKLEHLYVDEVDVEDIRDTELFDLSRYKIDFAKVDEVKAIIEGDYSRVKEFPNCAFILDVDCQTADRIQREYGVLVQPIDSIGDDDNVLTAVNPDYLFLQKGKQGAWREILSGLSSSRMPSNSLILIDRYLFNNINAAVENIKSITNELTPKSLFDQRFNILVIVQNDNINKDLFEQISLKIKNAICNEDINVDIICFRHGQGSEFTHNRRICSNYYILTAEYKLCAFNRNVSACTQNINIYGLFSKGLSSKSTCPNNNHTDTIGQLKKCLEKICKPGYSETYFFSHNGVLSEDVSIVMENELLKP